MQSESETKQEIRNWILKKNPKFDATKLLDSTPILEQRVISSLQIMDLILFLEKLSGKKVKLDQLKPQSFVNIDAIYKSFFGVIA